MQHKQIFIAGYYAVGLNGQSQCQKFIVFGVMASNNRDVDIY
jgi:hypothetical protein